MAGHIPARPPQANQKKRNLQNMKKTTLILAVALGAASAASAQKAIVQDGLRQDLTQVSNFSGTIIEGNGFCTSICFAFMKSSPAKQR